MYCALCSLSTEFSGLEFPLQSTSVHHFLLLYVWKPFWNYFQIIFTAIKMELKKIKLYYFIDIYVCLFLMFSCLYLSVNRSCVWSPSWLASFLKTVSYDKGVLAHCLCSVLKMVHPSQMCVWLFTFFVCNRWVMHLWGCTFGAVNVPCNCIYSHGTLGDSGLGHVWVIFVSTN